MNCLWLVECCSLFLVCCSLFVVCCVLFAGLLFLVMSPIMTHLAVCVIGFLNGCWLHYCIVRFAFYVAWILCSSGALGYP